LHSKKNREYAAIFEKGRMALMGIRRSLRCVRSALLWQMEELEARLAAGIVVAATPWGIAGPLPAIATHPAIASAASAVRVGQPTVVPSSPRAAVSPRAGEPAGDD
jgi:hypothetical protein